MKKENLVKDLDYYLRGWEKGDLLWTLTTKKRSLICQYRFEIDEERDVLKISWNREWNAEIEISNLFMLEMDACGFFIIRTRSFSVIQALLPEVKKCSEEEK